MRILNIEFLVSNSNVYTIAKKYTMESTLRHTNKIFEKSIIYLNNTEFVIQNIPDCLDNHVLYFRIKYLDQNKMQQELIKIGKIHIIKKNSTLPLPKKINSLNYNQLLNNKLILIFGIIALVLIVLIISSYM